MEFTPTPLPFFQNKKIKNTLIKSLSNKRRIRINFFKNTLRHVALSQIFFSNWFSKDKKYLLGSYNTAYLARSCPRSTHICQKLIDFQRNFGKHQIYWNVRMKLLHCVTQLYTPLAATLITYAFGAISACCGKVSISYHCPQMTFSWSVYERSPSYDSTTKCMRHTSL